MVVVCPDCGADGQEVGKFCENCGRLLTAADAQAAAASSAAPSVPPWDAAPATPGASPRRVRFAVVHGRAPDPAAGFTLTAPGEFLVGRPNLEAGTGVDVDLRQFVQPLVIGEQKQYLVHRSHLFLGLPAEGGVTVRPCAGAEGDTLVQAGGQGGFVPLSQFDSVRPRRPDATFPLQPGDRLFLGDPSALPYYQSGDPTAQGTYLVLELLPI